MSIKEDLVFDERIVGLVGFVNKHKWNFDSLNQQTLAAQALVFYIWGINSNLKQSHGFLETKSVTAGELFSIFWNAVGVLESCGLKVMAFTSDKALANQKLCQMSDILEKSAMKQYIFLH